MIQWKVVSVWDYITKKIHYEWQIAGTDGLFIFIHSCQFMSFNVVQFLFVFLSLHSGIKSLWTKTWNGLKHFMNLKWDLIILMWKRVWHSLNGIFDLTDEHIIHWTRNSKNQIVDIFCDIERLLSIFKSQIAIIKKKNNDLMLFCLQRRMNKAKRNFFSIAIRLIWFIS